MGIRSYLSIANALALPLAVTLSAFFVASSNSYANECSHILITSRKEPLARWTQQGGALSLRVDSLNQVTLSWKDRNGVDQEMAYPLRIDRRVLTRINAERLSRSPIQVGFFPILRRGDPRTLSGTLHVVVGDVWLKGQIVTPSTPLYLEPIELTWGGNLESRSVGVTSLVSDSGQKLLLSRGDEIIEVSADGTERSLLGLEFDIKSMDLLYGGRVLILRGSQKILALARQRSQISWEHSTHLEVMRVLRTSSTGVITYETELQNSELKQLWFDEGGSKVLVVLRSDELTLYRIQSQGTDATTRGLAIKWLREESDLFFQLPFSEEDKKVLAEIQKWLKPSHRVTFSLTRLNDSEEQVDVTFRGDGLSRTVSVVVASPAARRAAKPSRE